MSIGWRDRTSYQRGDKERKPRILEADIEGTRISIHRHKFCPDTWFLSCSDMNINTRDLDTDDFDVAVKTAVKVITSKVDRYKKIVEVLMKSNIEDMKFYEFNDFEYYALISAATKEAALNKYEEEVSDTYEGEDGEPEEIIKDAALKRILAICKNDEEKESATKEFEEQLKSGEPYIWLIDNSLI